MLPQASPRSVFGADESHAEALARIGHEFTREAVEAKRAGIERIAREHVERWPRGRPFRLLPRMRALADDIFVSEMLGATRAPGELVDAIGSLL